ncbi:MAG: helix-turn-helix transcriptional regulator [Oscillospiraceae bacterium]|nr:helix-turn-helix transcriptional regulator [Oscillospiraceae bacterium]
MSTLSCQVGQRIKKYRKSRGFTIAQLSDMIGKSKATISKYENGIIAIDVETLHDIARALGVALKYFLDIEETPLNSDASLPVDAYFNTDRAYMYYFDGRVNRVVKSLLRFSPAADGGGVEVTLYNDLDSFGAPDLCKSLYSGLLDAFDTITHIHLANQMNRAEKIYICLMNPLQNRAPAIGMMSGIGSAPFFAPASVKILIAKAPMTDDNTLLQSIKLSKEDLQLLRHCNMMVINRSMHQFY